jgi:anti-sigma regulatory factor (Ser/Thr protein kinase)
VLHTPLGLWTAAQGDWVVSTRQGTQLVPADTFPLLFDPDDDPPVDTSSKRFDASPEAVKAARSFVHSCLNGVEIDHDAAALLTSELATNALLHAGTAFDVMVTVDPLGVEITVSDSSPDNIAPVRPETMSKHGRGLVLVDSLADEWGTVRTDDHKDVWFRLNRRSSG